MVSKLTILVVVASALSVAMSAPNKNYGGGQYQESSRPSGGIYEDRPGQGHLGTVGTSGQSGGVYQETPGQGHLGVAGEGHHHGHLLGENGHGQRHQTHQLGENGHGQLGYHTQPGQEVVQGQHGGQYTEHTHGGGYQEHGY